MAWLQKRPQVSNPSMFYSMGLNKTILLVGLGNPGTEFENTRHNIGFACIDAFVTKNSTMEAWQQKKSLKSIVSSGRIGESRVIAIKPTTFMNLSGEAVRAVAQFYKVPLDATLVIYDELDIDFGQIRLRQGGASAGHHGIKSVSQQIGEGYGRIRIGIGPKQPAAIKSEDYVLQKFTTEQQAQVANLLQETTAIVSEYVYGGQLPHETRSFLI